MKRYQGGFTLIELMVVVATIGVLSAIAIPQFKQYQAKAFDAGARSDLRNAAEAEEAYFIDNETYKSCSGVTCQQALPSMRDLTVGVTLDVTGTTSGFVGTATHHSGTVAFTWDSNNGGLQD